MTSAIDELYAESFAKGFAEGYAEGYAKGFARGELRAAVRAVLTVLRCRFTTIPKDIESVISSMSAADALLSLITDAVRCESLDEFRNTLPRHE